MRILIACEESQAVTKEFRKLGHEAYSCDILECSGGHPEWHFKMDIFKAYNLHNWDLVISFPPCTDLAVSGAAHFERKRKDGSQEESIRFFFDVWKISNCTENPIGIMSGGKYIKKWFPELYQEMIDHGFNFKPSQIVQPYFYGDAYKKSTCLWLNDLPNLIDTDMIEPVFVEYNSKKTKSGKSKYSFMGQISTSNNNLKSKQIRSKTPQGLANAMATQWSKICDCQDYKNGLVSNSCPVHNEKPIDRDEDWF